MQFRIRSIDFTASGREIVRNREVETARLTVGRASENTIHLPDLAVEQQHLSLVPQANGTLLAEAAGTLGFAVDGKTTRSATIDPARGGEIAVGSFRLEVGRGEDGLALITIRQITEDAGEIKDRLRGFGLDRALPSRRVVSWLALAGILLAFLAVPIYTHLSRAEAEPDYDAQGQVLMDASWRTGSLSLAHHGLEDNCEACHTEPFVAVRDETCLSCHTESFDQNGDHADPTRMADGRAPFTGGEALLWQIANVFNKPGPGACTDCHTEHEGAGRMEPTSERFCADCHDSLDARLTDTALGNASDFGRLHPQFQALVTPVRGAEEVRMSLDEISGDFDGLKFPHNMHLSATNGVARMASRLDPRQRGGLECDNCHQPTADGVRFLPVNMEDSCEGCHSLVYDRVGTTFRTLRHGDVDEMQADLAAADRSPRRPVSSPLQSGRRRPGQFAEGGRYYSNFSRISPSGITRAAFADEGLCGECHYPATQANGRLGVVPVVQRDRYFQHGWFDHGPHDQEDCTTCHAADTSSRATDLLMPGIETCRDCHEGETAHEAEVPSSCAMCHSYHPRPGAAPARQEPLRQSRSQQAQLWLPFSRQGGERRSQ